MKVLVDTNVLISAMVFGGRPRRVLIRLLEDGHDLMVSEYIVKEFTDKIREKWADKAEFILDIFFGMDFRFCSSVKNYQGELRDKKDIPILSDALYHKVDVILSGDKDFLEAKIEKPSIYSVGMLEDFLNQ